MSDWRGVPEESVPDIDPFTGDLPVTPSQLSSGWNADVASKKDPLARQNRPHSTSRAKKDRKRWCGGHEGRKHQYEIVKRHDHAGQECHYSVWRYTWKGRDGAWVCYHARRCSVCGRYEDYSLSRSGYRCPDRPDDLPKLG